MHKSKIASHPWNGIRWNRRTLWILECIVWDVVVVVRPSLSMMNMTSMTISWWVDHVGAEVTNQSKLGLHPSPTLGARVGRIGWGDGARVKSHFANSMRFQSVTWVDTEHMLPSGWHQCWGLLGTFWESPWSFSFTQKLFVLKTSLW